jgi:hypothetical protein
MLEPGLANPGRWPAALRKRAIVSMLALGVSVSGATVSFAHDTPGNEPNTVANTAAQSGAYRQVASMGRAVQLDGTMQILHEDYSDGTSRFRYFLESNGERFELYFGAGAPTHLLTGSPVRVNGLRANHEIAVDSPTADIESLFGPTSAMVSPLVVSGTFGVQRVAVMLVNFSDNAAQPYTPAQATPLFFTTTSNWDLENSYGQTSLTGSVFGWYTIAASSTVCDYSAIATQARAAATAAGVNLANYNRYVYAFPNNACGWWGLGTVGGNPSSAWINGSLQLRVIAHEMGHNFGLYHSHAWDCGALPIGIGCTSIEYGDTMDVMGGSSYHFNAFQKERLGWLNYGASPPITQVTGSGTYVVDGYETVGSSPKALKIPIGTAGSNYYVELRRPLGFDAGMSSNPNMMNGVLIHQASPSNPDSSQLLDMTTSSSWSDPALVVGQSFTDSTNQITITPLSITSTNASVAVTFGSAGCTRVNPSVTMSPSQSAAVAGGTMVSFTTTVTNNDTANCAASTFDLTNAVPAGGTWTATYLSSALSVSPGATVSTTLQVTSPASAASGSNQITATARNHGATAYAGSASAMYMVAGATCTRANPTVTLSPATSAGVTSGTAVSFTISVTNKDSGACAASTFDLTRTVPANWTGTLTSSALSLSPGASSTATLQVTSAAAAANGNFPVSATATNHGATSFKAMGSATYVVSNPVCTRANPTVTLSPSQSAGVVHGTQVSFDVLVTNKDSVACAASTFNLTKSAPSGWTSTLSPTTLSLSPGASNTAVLQVTSAAAAANGNFPVTATATNGGATSFKATGSATYVVASSGGTTGTFSDNFNRSGPAIGTAWTQVAGSFVINDNMLKNAPQSGNALAVVSALSGGTQTASADFTSVDNNLGPRFGIVLSYKNPTNYYLLYRQTGGSSRLLISKIVNGVETILGSSSLSNPQKGVPFHITGSVTGTTLKLDFNGVTKVTVTDATFTAGKVGIMVGTGGTFQQQADNFTATVQ